MSREEDSMLRKFVRTSPIIVIPTVLSFLGFANIYSNHIDYTGWCKGKYTRESVVDAVELMKAMDALEGISRDLGYYSSEILKRNPKGMEGEVFFPCGVGDEYTIPK